MSEAGGEGDNVIRLSSRRKSMVMGLDDTVGRALDVDPAICNEVAEVFNRNGSSVRQVVVNSAAVIATALIQQRDKTKPEDGLRAACRIMEIVLMHMKRVE